MHGWSWLALGALSLGFAALACGGAADGGSVSPNEPASSAPVCARAPCASAASTAPSTSRGGACGPDGVVWGSFAPANPAAVNALAGCERVAGDLSLVALGSAPFPALASLKIVDGLLTIHGLAGEGALDSLVSLEQVGGLELHRLRPKLATLSRLRRIGRAEGDPLAADPVASGLQISECLDLYSLAGLTALEQVDHLTLLDNSQLSNLSGMISLRELGTVRSQGNPLRNLEGISPVRDLTVISSQLMKLKGLGAASQLRRLELRNNEALLSLRGATFPAEMDEIILQDNPLLEDISALDTVKVPHDPSLPEE